jgi:nucleotide-binding universal stress UspA family protein
VQPSLGSLSGHDCDPCTNERNDAAHDDGSILIVIVWRTPVERITPANAYRAIVAIAGEENPELVLMGVHGKGALGRRLFGSTTHHVIREGRCPVLTLRG